MFVDCSDGFRFTAPVGMFKPNPFGLDHMMGNVWEFLGLTAMTMVPRRSRREAQRLNRDWGSWTSPPNVDVRAPVGPKRRDFRFGFRVAKSGTASPR